LLLEFLHVQLVSQVLNVLVVRTAFLFFGLEPLEDLLSSCLGLGFLRLDLCLTSFLLLGITLEHLRLIFFHLLLFSLKLTLFLHTLDHIQFCLLLLHFDESNHLLIFVNHFLNDFINLILFL
jgi:hypothetical protein